MEVYEFDKSLLQRMEESMNVLSWNDENISATQVRAEWSYYIELQMEPAGWQALWKIPKVICEELGVRYPTVVFGYVEQVLFKELKAVFLVLAVQDDDIHLPERHEVLLIDLYPTKNQENESLVVDRTADCLDQLRFFYTHVWMPWDNDADEDINWVEKHLESRIRFFYDLQKHCIKRALSAHIRTLLADARYLQQKREFLELDLNDDDQLEDTADKSQITDLMRLHLRLAMIRNEVEMLENPELRCVYEEINFKNTAGITEEGKQLNNAAYHIVTLPSTVQNQIELMSDAQKHIGKEVTVTIGSSLQDVLNNCKGSDIIFLSPGHHMIKFLESLNEDGRLVGLMGSSNLSKRNDVIITSADNESNLLIFDGDFSLENIILDCSKVRRGILVKRGKVVLKSCHIIGEDRTSTQEAIVCMNGGTIILENCKVEKFATGIVLKSGATGVFQNTKLMNCRIGFDLNAKMTSAVFENVFINDSKLYGIYIDSLLLTDTTKSIMKMKNLMELKENNMENSLKLSGSCHFENCQCNIYVINTFNSIVAEQTLDYLFEGNDKYNK